ncbi:hypothetical protein [Amycolatopsis pigmentata]|uniref:Uncharacterized protein n=1 Tax=Amycolatopsis pigmentata TaxID=450801 RepID=A0ABW5FTV1_9PSEU
MRAGWGIGLVIVLATTLTACEQVGSAGDKASVCAEALGLANFDPQVDPAELADEAAKKADRLRQLANQASDADLKQNLITIADSYVALEKRRAEDLGNLNDWIQRNAGNIAKLRSACF